MFRLLCVSISVAVCAAENPGALSLVPLERLNDRAFSALAGFAGGRFPSLDALEREFKPYAATALRPN